MRKMLTIAAAAVALGAGAAVLAPAVRADATRPFKGTCAGSIVGATSETDLIIDYTGSASHLGDFTRREYVSLVDGVVTGHMDWVAANGDTLTCTFSGGFVSATVAEGTYTFTGGTGRFAGVTGTAAFRADAANLPNVTATFEGTLDY